ncbi:MAG: GntR family transcriptional regulator [Anaerorhabdus sp.]
MKLQSKPGDRPLWSQVYDIISDRIASNVYDVGMTLPTEMQFIEEFGVSRVTIRQAMDRLISNHLIERRRGKGTIVLNRNERVETRMQSNFVKTEELNERQKRLIKVQWTIPEAEILSFFNLQPKSKVLEIIRHSYIGNELIGIHETFISPHIEFSDQFAEEESLYQRFENMGIGINSLAEEIRANVITKKEKIEFKTSKNTAIINRIRKGYHDSEPIEYTKIKYISDGYKLTIDSRG